MAVGVGVGVGVGEGVEFEELFEPLFETGELGVPFTELEDVPSPAELTAVICTE